MSGVSGKDNIIEFYQSTAKEDWTEVHSETCRALRKHIEFYPENIENSVRDWDSNEAEIVEELPSYQNGSKIEQQQWQDVNVMWQTLQYLENDVEGPKDFAENFLKENFEEVEPSEKQIELVELPELDKEVKLIQEADESRAYGRLTQILDYEVVN